MRSILSIVIFSALFISHSQTTKKVCFLGNSYTYYNDLPSLIDSLANHSGNDLIKDESTPGGFQLNQHVFNPNSLAKIAGNNWDYVVLQEQSQLPSFPITQVVTDVYPFAKILVDSIRSANACAIPLFFNTWGREKGDSQWDSIDTFIKMNDRLFNAYTFMANSNSGINCPVGYAFGTIFSDPNAIIAHGMLYSSDGSHPSIFGSYLAACLFNNMIFQTTSSGNSFLPAGITNTQAIYLQQIADQVLSMGSSPIFEFTHPFASFTNTIPIISVSFTNTSQHAFSYYWDFGDGITSELENPTHIYNQSGTFNVKLTAKYCERIDSFSKTIEVMPLAVNLENKSTSTVFPNPSSGQFKLDQKDQIINNIELYAINGKLIQSFPASKRYFDLNLNKGLYFLKINQGIQKIIIE